MKEATKAMSAKDWQKLGKLMYQLHNSLKNDYKVSCDELDYLVKLSQNFARIYGARMTGVVLVVRQYIFHLPSF